MSNYLRRTAKVKFSSCFVCLGFFFVFLDCLFVYWQVYKKMYERIFMKVRSGSRNNLEHVGTEFSLFILFGLFCFRGCGVGSNSCLLPTLRKNCERISWQFHDRLEMAQGTTPNMCVWLDRFALLKWVAVEVYALGGILLYNQNSRDPFLEYIFHFHQPMALIPDDVVDIVELHWTKVH